MAGWATYLAVPSALSPAASATVLETDTIGGVTVLTDAEGFTLYWFAPDTATRSNCDASCARHWPPVTGPVTAGRGVRGAIGTITRSGGSVQATYDGHPLYTASLDAAPGPGQGQRPVFRGRHLARDDRLGRHPARRQPFRQRQRQRGLLTALPRAAHMP